MKRCQKQLKVADILKSLKVENLTDVNSEDCLLQGLRIVNWKGFFKGFYHIYQEEEWIYIYPLPGYFLFINWHNILFFHRLGKISVYTIFVYLINKCFVTYFNHCNWYLIMSANFVYVKSPSFSITFTEETMDWE